MRHYPIQTLTCDCVALGRPAHMDGASGMATMAATKLEVPTKEGGSMKVTLAFLARAMNIFCNFPSAVADVVLQQHWGPLL